MVWPTTKAFARYNFQPGDDPGAEFIKLVGPGLKETGMNNYGVLAALNHGVFEILGSHWRGRQADNKHQHGSLPEIFREHMTNESSLIRFQS